MKTQLRPVAAAISLSLIALAASSIPALAATDAELQELNQLRFEVKQLKLINERQAKTLQTLESRLNRLEGKSPVIASTQPASTAPVATDEPEVKKSAGPNKSVEALLGEEHTLFGGSRWTFETGLTYTHYDRKQLVLDGFLALDAIFLGNISVGDNTSDILTLDLGAKYNVNDRWQLAANLPLVNRWATYEETNNSAGVSASVDRYFTPGDLELASYYQLHKETTDLPDIVWNLRLKAPTGKDPYGIPTASKTNTVGADTATITYPSDLPTGSGLWSLGTGFSFAKTIDPAILFANVEYTHQFAGDFDNVNGAPGSVRLGDSLAFGAGMAFALNEKMSVSFSYSQKLQERAEQKAAGGAWTEVIGSDANAATFNTGITYSLSDRTAISGNLSVGLTPDAPDFSVGVRIPYSF